MTAGAKDGMSRTTFRPAVPAVASSERSRATTPSAILPIGYGMSGAEVTSAGLNVACVKLDMAQKPFHCTARTHGDLLHIHSIVCPNKCHIASIGAHKKGKTLHQ